MSVIACKSESPVTQLLGMNCDKDPHILLQTFFANAYSEEMGNSLLVITTIPKAACNSLQILPVQEGSEREGPFIVSHACWSFSTEALHQINRGVCQWIRAKKMVTLFMYGFDPSVPAAW